MPDELVFNGVDGATGRYLLAGVDRRAVARLARGELDALDDDGLDALDDTTAYIRQRKGRGVLVGVDPRRLDEAGWAVVFPRYRGDGHLDGLDAAALNARVDAVRAALAPLIEHRRAQAGRVVAGRFRVLDYPIGLPPGRPPRPVGKHRFLADLRPPVDGSMPAVPDRLPYYILLVGGPDQIPFRFQYQLDVQYAVGRLHFEALDDYAAYARAVVAAETGPAPRPRAVALWGPRTPGDPATTLSADHLLRPLADRLAAITAEPAFVEAAGQWTVDAADVARGERDRLAGLLGGSRTPALAFTASHGLYYPPADPRHRSHTGALLCAGWTPGAPPPDAARFAADDLAPDADLAGLVSFHFACYGAGVPARDGFARRGSGAALGGPFTARLPQRLLAGGALAVIGHVDRAWSASFSLDGDGGGQIATFEGALRLLLEGYPVGHAMDPFDARYAATTADITEAIDAHRDDDGELYDDDAWMADRWLASNDARNYAVLGDPAVRLAVAPVE